jgi:uncharacterized protein YdaU (DUF1376 family)
MPLYIPDFLADTVHLSAAETGAYLCLIMDYWLHDGLPDDDQKLAQIARLPVKSWRQMRPTIEMFFRPGWRHKRIDAELAKMVGLMEARRAAGSKGGTASTMARWNDTSKRQANLKQTHQQTLSKQPSKTEANVNHLTQESITTTFSGAPRATQNWQNSPEIEPKEPKSQAANPVATPAGFAREAREAVAKTAGSLGSGELVATMQAKGWVKPC